MKLSFPKLLVLSALLGCAIILAIPLILHLLRLKRFGGPERDLWKLDEKLTLGVARRSSGTPGGPEVSRIEIYQTAESTAQTIFYYPISRLNPEWLIYSTDNHQKISAIIGALQREATAPSAVDTQAYQNRLPTRFHLIAYQAKTSKIAYIIFRIGYVEQHPYGFESLSGFSLHILNTAFCDWLAGEHLLPAPAETK